MLNLFVRTGEAVYVDDIPSPPHSLHGALIYSTKPLARVKGISFEAVPKPSGIVDVISAKDIPQGGQNFGATALFGSEYLFAEDTTASAGDLIAFVVYETSHMVLIINGCLSDFALLYSLGCT